MGLGGSRFANVRHVYPYVRVRRWLYVNVCLCVHYYVKCFYCVIIWFTNVVISTPNHYVNNIVMHYIIHTQYNRICTMYAGVYFPQSCITAVAYPCIYPSKVSELCPPGAPCWLNENNREVGGQAVLGRQSLVSTPWLTERHGYDPTLAFISRNPV